MIFVTKEGFDFNSCTKSRIGTKIAGRVNIDEKNIFAYVMVYEDISCFKDIFSEGSVLFSLSGMVFENISCFRDTCILNFVTNERFAL